jgi:RecA/RadA recombinase
MFSGGKGSGKTTVSFKAVGHFQEMTAHLDPAPLVLWVDVEGVYDAEWARVCGVDLERLYVVRPSFAEQAIDVFCSMLSAKEIEFLVMDSIAALVPAKEIESSAMDQQQGLQARLVGKMIRRVNGAMNDWAQRDTPRTVLFINQVRQKIGGFSPSGMTPEVEPGGLGQIFAASVTVRFKRMKYEFANDADRQNGVGATTALNRFDVRNSKVSTPGQTGEFRLLLRDFAHLHRGDTDDLKLVAARAQSLEYLRQEGGQWVMGTPGSRLVHAAPTKQKMMEAWLTDRLLYARAQADVIALSYRDGMHGASTNVEQGGSDERSDSDPREDA